MSGAFIKTFSILSFLILAVGLVVVSPGVDAAAANTVNTPYSGIDTDVTELDAYSSYYILVGSSVSVTPYYEDGVVYQTIGAVTDGYGLSLTLTDDTTDINLYTLSGTISHAGTIILTVLTEQMGSDSEHSIKLYAVESGSDTSDSGEYTDYSDSGDAGDSGSGDGESGSGSTSDDNGGSSSDGDQSSAGDDNTDGSEEDFSDSSTAERQSSPVLAVLILVAGALLIWWIVKKVRH